MPYQVQHILEGKGKPVYVAKEDLVAKALSLMIEHDFSQLPVVHNDDGYEVPIGMITYEGILRGVRNFKAKIEDLRVRDVMINAPTYSLEDDLFDILDRMKDTNAVLVTEGPDLVGIVTSYDTTEYFRDRTEDLMRIEDIELMIRDFIKEAYLLEDGHCDDAKLSAVIAKVAKPVYTSEGKKGKSFDELTLNEYITLLILEETWGFFESIFSVPRIFVNELLQGVREIRNALAHFRGDISAEQRDRLKFCAEWLSKRQEEYQERKEQVRVEKLIKLAEEKQRIGVTKTEELTDIFPVSSEQLGSVNFSITGAESGGGRYAALADWLQSQPGKIDQVNLTFNQIEEIIGADLPASARSHRAWWANDSVGHTQSQLWLEAGWRTTYINFTEGKITFSRIREREKAYIAFFSKLLDELRKKADFPIRDASPDGASWIVIQTILYSGSTNCMFGFSFSRNKQLRVELYLDMGDQARTKLVFDKLFNQREQFESRLSEIHWERLETRRASRIALYHEGHISEEKTHKELRNWAAESMVKFYHVLAEPAEKAISEVKDR